MISVVTHELTLYHVILATRLSGIPLTLLSLTEIVSPLSSGPFLPLANNVRWFIATSLLLCYTLKAPCFGSQPSCNAIVKTKYFFSVSYAINDRGRTTSLLGVAFIIPILLWQLYLGRLRKKLAIMSLVSASARSSYRKLTIARASFLGVSPRKPITLFYVHAPFSLLRWMRDNDPPLRLLRQPEPLPQPVTASATRRNSVLRRNAHSILKHAVTTLRYPKVQRFLLALPITCILVMDIEATIKLNNVGVGENSWTYGQILAVVLTIVPVVQVLRLVGWLPSGKDDKWKVKVD
jgi:hypothetical protein